MSGIPEEFARRILQKTLDEHRAGELLDALFEGGSVTIDAESGELVIITHAQLHAFMERGEL